MFRMQIKTKLPVISSYNQQNGPSELVKDKIISPCSGGQMLRRGCSEGYPLGVGERKGRRKGTYY